MNKERQNKIRNLRAKLSSLSPEQRQLFIDKGMVSTIEGRVLSHVNTILVYLQSNGQPPSIVGGFRQWIKAGRAVKRGEHGMMVWFPVGTKNEDTGDIEDVEHFYTGTVFDISQTEELKGA